MGPLSFPDTTDDYGLSWYSWRNGPPRRNQVILCGNTGPTVDGMPCVYLGMEPDAHGEWIHWIFNGSTTIWVKGFRLGERR